MMLRTIPVFVVIALCLGLGGAVVVQRHQLAAVRASRAVLALRVVNAAAELDTTRSSATMNQKVAALLGDSLGLVEKRVRQVTQRSDALDRALGRERRANYTMGVVIDSLRQSATAMAVEPVGADNDVRRASFDIRQAPYTVAAHVEIPKPPGLARLALHVSVDTISVRARLTCAPAGEQGIRTASIVASTPAWAKLRFGQVEQSPDVCHTPDTKRAATRRFTFKPLSIGIGRAAIWGGATGWALFVGAVITWS